MLKTDLLVRFFFLFVNYFCISVIIGFSTGERLIAQSAYAAPKNTKPIPIKTIAFTVPLLPRYLSAQPHSPVKLYTAYRYRIIAAPQAISSIPIKKRIIKFKVL